MAGIVGHFGRRDSKRGGVTRHDPTAGRKGRPLAGPTTRPAGVANPRAPC